ncbi:molybdopterin converting factor [Paenibacillus sp. CAA11]|uniref:molybdenum cofactor biosynthesis protein n=1 Tax=Paenibacillus sp. CAA11 TaxID=1532905 RepID=UPI000D37B71C|nr:molybdenum cofactor biosynthesis protein MoaE [Paenibacillus sp. CAA11]AWB44022.1 molybdopterin converting factor [Paenibacillus sp. CAA11]
MQLTIRLFAGLADRFGTSSLGFSITEQDITASGLKVLLKQEYPEAAALIETSFVAVNQEYAAASTKLSADDEIALIPPVSGGEEATPDAEVYQSEDGRYVLTSAPLAVEEVTAKVITANHGASIAFVGTTREMTGQQRTVRLEYEAYAPMALSKMQAIGKEISQQWPGTLCAISHRTGLVDIAEISVVIAVSSPHRDSCYDASRYAIERLKQIVPIWKKEIWEDGSEWKGHQLGPWNPQARMTGSVEP